MFSVLVLISVNEGVFSLYITADLGTNRLGLNSDSLFIF